MLLFHLGFRVPSTALYAREGELSKSALTWIGRWHWQLISGARFVEHSTRGRGRATFWGREREARCCYEHLFSCISKGEKFAIVLIIRHFFCNQNVNERVLRYNFHIEIPLTRGVMQLTSVLGLLRIQDNWRYPQLISWRRDRDLPKWPLLLQFSTAVS